MQVLIEKKMLALKQKLIHFHHQNSGECSRYFFGKNNVRPNATTCIDRREDSSVLKAQNQSKIKEAKTKKTTLDLKSKMTISIIENMASAYTKMEEVKMQKMLKPLIQKMLKPLFKKVKEVRQKMEEVETKKTTLDLKLKHA
jgi:hypothetical protein